MTDDTQLFTTNKPLAGWGVVLHDPDLAEAILDRVLERGRLLEQTNADSLSEPGTSGVTKLNGAL